MPCCGGVARGTGFLGRVIPAASAKLSQSRYSVRLTVNGQSFTQPLVVKPDPRERR